MKKLSYIKGRFSFYEDAQKRQLEIKFGSIISAEYEAEIRKLIKKYGI